MDKKTAFILLEMPGYDTNQPSGTAKVFSKLLDFISKEGIEYFLYYNCEMNFISRFKSLITNYFRIRKNLKNIKKIVIQSKEDSYIITWLLSKKIAKYNIKVILLHMDIHNSNNPYMDTTRRHITFLEKKIFLFVDEVFFMTREHREAYMNYEITGNINIEILAYFEEIIKSERHSKTKKIFFGGVLDEPRKKILNSFSKLLYDYDKEYIIDVYGNNSSVEGENIKICDYIDLTRRENINFLQKEYDVALILSLDSRLFSSKLRDVYAYSMPILNLTIQKEKNSFCDEVEKVGGYNFIIGIDHNLDFLEKIQVPKDVYKYSYNYNKNYLLDILM